MSQIKKQPLISIIMPVYNTAMFLSLAIQSIQKQTHSNWELIIIDDHSTDSSFSIAKKFARNDSRITVYSNKRNLGVAFAANKALQYARGQFIARMDSDDISHPQRLKKQLAFLQKHTDVIAIGGQCEVIDEQGDLIGAKRFPTQPKKVKEMLFQFASMQQPTMMVNREKLPKNFQWYRDGLHATEEHELLFKLLQYGQLANLADMVLQYRFHKNNISKKTPKKDFFLILSVRLRAVRKYHYHPSLKGTLTNIVQLCVVTLLPSQIVYWVYATLRGLNKPDYSKFSTVTSEIKGKLPSLSLFFPLHNEAENIRRVVAQAQEVAPRIAEKYEIILVNDGSTDRTSQIAHKLANRDTDITVIDQENKGYGGALHTGFEAAQYEWIFFADGDSQFDLHELTHFVPFTATHKVVLGYRKQRADALSRIALAKLLRIWNMIFFRFPHNVKDIDCAFKLFHRSVVEELFPLQSVGALISTELFLKLIDAQYDYAQVGVTHYPRIAGKQTGARWHVIWGAMKETWQLWSTRHELRLPSLRYTEA